MTELISIREFARREGCSHTLVGNAIKRGSLRLSDDRRLDAALVGTGWRKRNRRGNPGGNTAAPAAPNGKVARWRIDDLSIARDAIVPLNEFEAYWRSHAPDAQDLAEVLETTPAHIEQLWREGVLARGASLYDQWDQWDDHEEQRARVTRHGK